MNVRHQGHGGLLGEAAQYFGGRYVRHGKTQETAAHTGQALNPLRRGFPGGPFKVFKRKAVFPHGLNHHGKSAADIDGPDMIKTADFYGLRNPHTKINNLNKGFSILLPIALKKQSAGISGSFAHFLYYKE
jgi:hypothetical protein